MSLTRFALLLSLLTPGCSTVSSFVSLSPDFVAVHTETGRSVSIDEMADELSRRDVVCLGELHDNDVGHRLQLELTKALHERRDGKLVVCLEMFERDVDLDLEDYLTGRIDEQTFLESSRPWPNYREHYRPVVEWAKENGVRVVAANIPRPVARRVSREGIAAVRKAEWMPQEFEAPVDEYHRRFFSVMGGDRPGADLERLYRFYCAQCVKDEVMAESIVHWTRMPTDGAIIVFWCGRFHSDYGLGTAQRVLRRRPDLDLAVVSTTVAPRRASALSDDEQRSGDYVWIVPEPD